jgi:hypothetical protein
MSAKIFAKASIPEPSLGTYIDNTGEKKPKGSIGKIKATTYVAKNPPEHFEIESHKWFKDAYRAGQQTLTFTVREVNTEERFFIAVNKTNATRLADDWGGENIEDWYGHVFKIPRVDRSNPKYPMLVLVPVE